MNDLISNYIAAKKAFEEAAKAVNRVATQKLSKDPHKNWFSILGVDLEEEKVILSSRWQGADCDDSKHVPISFFDEQVD